MDESTQARLTRLFPEQGEISLGGLYLSHDLQGLARRLGRPLVITGYITDRRGLIANTGQNGELQVPPELKNPYDWQLFQELMAQADLVISGSRYLKRLEQSGEAAEDILYQFEPGKKFAALGQWRLDNGFQKRQPDLVFLTHHLDFEFPPGLLEQGRRILIFTTDTAANSEKAGEMTSRGVMVIGCGLTGVDGKRLMDYLTMDPAFRVIMLATGPGALDLLMEAGQLDLLYLTQVQKEVPFSEPASIRTLLPNGKPVEELEEFHLTHRYLQSNVVTEDGVASDQEFHRYDKKGLPDM